MLTALYVTYPRDVNRVTATLDQRHFRAVRPLAGGEAFRLLPADA